MPKIKNGKSPYGIFTEKKMDMKRDFQVDYWQEPIVEKNLKVTYLISSAGDLLLWDCLAPARGSWLLGMVRKSFGFWVGSRIIQKSASPLPFRFVSKSKSW